MGRLEMFEMRVEGINTDTRMVQLENTVRYAVLRVRGCLPSKIWFRVPKATGGK